MFSSLASGSHACICFHVHMQQDIPRTSSLCKCIIPSVAWALCLEVAVWDSLPSLFG